ncbi:hypothetical protein [Vibrio coralliilyticus]|uniref:hypothetical protein n=1 Tax=Vibrio coralliilyticus TaxID=190893 RepID=UPI001C102443|nr:hypothetical protein [Vibrio coralliilyticus]
MPYKHSTSSSAHNRLDSMARFQPAYRKAIKPHRPQRYQKPAYAILGTAIVTVSLPYRLVDSSSYKRLMKARSKAEIA